MSHSSPVLAFLSALSHHSKSIIRISKLRRNATPRRAPCNLDVWSPGPAARRSPRARLRPPRILLRRNQVVPRVIPIQAPFVHVLAHIVQPVPVLFGHRDRFRPFAPSRAIPGSGRHRPIAPRIQLLLHPAARRKLPLGFARQPDLHPRSEEHTSELQSPC